MLRISQTCRVQHLVLWMCAPSDFLGVEPLTHSITQLNTHTLWTYWACLNSHLKMLLFVILLAWQRQMEQRDREAQIHNPESHKMTKKWPDLKLSG